MTLHLPRIDAFRVAAALLFAWACGLVIAAVQLDTWRQEITQTLVQLKADTQFRTRIARGRDDVDPQWYRRKALSLLAVMERMQADISWTLVMPGSWRTFDDLEERLATRIEREFADIVVETMRRELSARAARLTGAALDPDPTAADQCAMPLPHRAARRATVAAHDLPEFAALRDYVGEVESLGDAMQAFVSLQRSGAADPQQLRALVRYTLGTELPVTLSRTAPMFRDAEEVPVRPSLMLSGMQWAARCALLKGVDALHARLLANTELFALEEAYRSASAGLFDAQRPLPFDRALARYRALVTVLQDQEQLLAAGGNGWMREGARGLGPDYDELVTRIAANSLLGAPTVEAVQQHSNAAFEQFRRRFEATFGGGPDAGIQWAEAEQRFALSPQRVALREALQDVLDQPIVQADARGEFDAEEAASWVDARDTFAAAKLQPLAQPEREAIARFVDNRIAQIISARVMRTLRVRGGGEDASFDAAAYQQDAALVEQADAVLSRIDADAPARRLWAAHFEPLFGRLAALDAQMQQVAFAVPDETPGPPSVQDLVVRVERLSRQAGMLLAAAEPRVLGDARARRWTRLAGELRLWKVHRIDIADPIPGWIAPFAPVSTSRECPAAAGSPEASSACGSAPPAAARPSSNTPT